MSSQDFHTNWSDPVLGEFTWNKDHSEWNGTCTFQGRVLPLTLEFDYVEPTREEQVTIFETARAILPRLAEKEPELRHQAGKEIAEAIVSQQAEGPDRVELDVKQFAEGLELESIGIGNEGWGLLAYLSPEFPEQSLFITFDEELEFDGSEVADV